MEGAYLLARREAVEQVGGLDEQIFMYAEDVDWCYRFHQAGWEVWYHPQVEIVHYGGQSSRKRQSRMEAELYRSRVYFFGKHRGRGSALVLKALVYGLTAVKIVVHRAIRSVSRGRRGRNVPSWRQLRAALKGAEVLDSERRAL
jgi:GT2 family glycosyltransferase